MLLLIAGASVKSSRRGGHAIRVVVICAGRPRQRRPCGGRARAFLLPARFVFFFFFFFHLCLVHPQLPSHPLCSRGRCDSSQRQRRLWTGCARHAGRGGCGRRHGQIALANGCCGLGAGRRWRRWCRGQLLGLLAAAAGRRVDKQAQRRADSAGHGKECRRHGAGGRRRR